MTGTDNPLPPHDAVRMHLRMSICNAVREESAAFLGSDLLALILTGSLARDEASTVDDGSGLRFLSDAEFLVVVRSRTARSLHSQLTARVEVALARLGLRIHISLALVQPGYLALLPPHIFTYELRSCGQVIAGDAAILASIPEYTVSELSREDAWRLLANRMTEFLESAGDIGHKTPSPETQYRAVKLFLDMATSLLVFLDEYEPTYQGRTTRLVTLAASDPSRFPFPAMEFTTRVAQCTAFKLSPEGFDPPASLCRDAIDYARRLWTWELRSLTGASGSDEVLFRQHCRQLSTLATLRGWMYAVRTEGWHQGWRHWSRWLTLFTRGTPRYCIYEAAHLVFCQLPADSAPKQELARKVEQLLPVSCPRMNQASWKDLADDIVWNYRRFAVETRA